MIVYAVVSDLMDRSRLAAAVPGLRFARTAGECADGDVIVVDLTRGTELVAALRGAAPGARIVAYGPHVDADGLAAARAAGADTAVPRSRFFRDIPAAIA
ncbi:MAG TPA: DNA-binding response regulator [Acidimicrobiia bacterium]|nr:DNA-binding response regulator [Acidimicrobiia bacterium]